MRKIGYFLLLLFILTLSGCNLPFVSSSSVEKPKKSAIERDELADFGLPDWYSNPPLSNSESFYGAGEGDTKKEAIATALSQIASEISTTISSTFESEKSYSSKDNSYSITAKNQVKAVVKAIDFHEAVVEESEMVGKKHFALMKQDRKTLFKGNYRDFQQMERELLSLYNLTLKEGGFHIILNREEIQKRIATALAKASLLNSISPAFNFKKRNIEYGEMNDKLLERASSIWIVIRDSSNLGYGSVLKKYLTQKGYKISNNSNGTADTIFIDLKVKHTPTEIKTTNSRYKDLSFAQMKILISTQNSRGKEVAKNLISFRNHGKSYDEAISRTAGFEKEIERAGGVLSLLRGE
jgi:hypothetical protein